MIRRLVLHGALAVGMLLPAMAQDGPAVTILRPARVFDGEAVHEGWGVRVRDNRIDAAGPIPSIDSPGAALVNLPGATLLPGLGEGHSHVLLPAYDQTPGNEQVAQGTPRVAKGARRQPPAAEPFREAFPRIPDPGDQRAVLLPPPN